MGINSETEITATLQIGPTSEGMVRLFVQAGNSEIPFDFDPEEADDIAAEISAAAARARATKSSAPKKKSRNKNKS